MASSAANALTDLAAALVVSRHQWWTGKSTNASAIRMEDDIRAIEEQIERVSDTAKLPTPDRSKLDSVGTELWNVCRVHVMEECPDDVETKTMNSRVLAVVVALLDIASPSNAPGHVRVLEVTFEASRVCIDTDQLDCALKILKVAAKRFDSMQGDAPAIDQVQRDSITAEYYMLRVHLAWKQGRPDIADHLFTRVPLKATIKNRSTIVEQCLCIGRIALETDQHETSAKWLEIALGQLHENQDDEALSSTDFDFYIRHHLACAYSYLSTNALEAAAKLEDQMDILKTQYGENPAVQYLELEMMRLGLNQENDKFFETMKGVINRPDYTEQEFENLMVYIQYSMHLSFYHAFEICQSLLKSLPTERREWIENCFLRLPRIVGTLSLKLHIPDESCIAVMKEALAILEARGIEMMSQETTDGFFMVLLNLLEGSDGVSCQHIAEKWCQLALESKVFKSTFVSTNLGLQKSLATVCFDNNNVTLARRILDQIVANNDSKCDPGVQGLLFRLALHDEKDVCLKDYLCELSSRSSHFDQLKLLRSCAAAAAELKNPRLVIDCIQEFMRCTILVDDFPKEVLVKQNSFECEGSLSVAESCLFPLLFLLNVMQREQDVSEMDVLSLVNSVLRWAKRGLGSTNVAFSIGELESVGLYSYTMAVHVFNMFHSEGIEEVLELTKDIFDLSIQRHESGQTTDPEIMPSKSQEEESDSVPLGLIAYRFLYFEANTRAFCVQTQTDASRKLEHYAKVCESIKKIRDQIPEYSASHPLGTNALENLLIIEFEATVALKQWSAISSVVRESEKFINSTVFNRLMDCIVTFEMPDAHRAIAIKIMLETIRRAGELPPAVSDQLSAYYHFLFAFALAAAKSEDSARLPEISQKWPDAYYEMAESVVDEFLQPAGNMSDPKPRSGGNMPSGDSLLAVSGPFDPSTEEQEYLYLAKCSFNQAMDFYSAENDQACLRWAQKAILLARTVRSTKGGELVSLFQKRLEGLF